MTKKPTPKRSRPAPLVDAATVSMVVRFYAQKTPVTRRAMKSLVEEKLLAGGSVDGVTITSVTVRDVDAP